MNSQVYGSAKGMRNALSINFFKSALFAAALIVSVGIFLVSCKPQEKEYVSADTPFCNCTVKYGEEEMKLSPPEMMEDTVLNSILDKAGFSLRPFKICKVKKIPDKNIAAFATLINDFPYIVYDAKKISKMKFASKWALHKILAHEVGHLVNYHTTDHSPPKHELELEADAYSGFILYQFGVPLDESFKLFSEDAEATKKHPSGKDSRIAFENGWLKASNLFPSQTPQEVKYPTAPPKRGYATIRGQLMPIIKIGDREIIAQNLSFKIGGARRYGDSFFSNGLLYTHNEAKTLCKQLGPEWELIRLDDMKALLTPKYGNLDNEYKNQGYDEVVGYGSIIVGGQSGFNGDLGGCALVNYDGTYNFAGKDEIGNYWVAELDDTYGQPIYFSLNVKKGTIVMYRDDEGLANYCRCARDVQEQSPSNGEIGYNN